MKRNHDVCTSLDDLIDDLKLEILCRLPVKLLAKFTCVSKAWQRLIINFCFPKIASKLAFSTYVTSCNRSILFRDYRLHNSYEGLWKRLKRFRKSSRDSLLDSCNGLVLLCIHNSITGPNLYRYFVLNILTKQCAIITKPYPKTGRNKYAALAYDPSKSCHYKIVRFQGFRSLNIFCSKSGNWITLRYRLENHIIRKYWEDRSVYFKRALYRLSMSGHLIRFFVDKKINASGQVQAIELPDVARAKPHGCVGLNKGQIHFSHSDESNMRIWVLQHKSNSSYEWLLKYTIPSNRIPTKDLRPLVFHPFDDTIILCLEKSIRNIMMEYHFGDRQVSSLSISHIYFWNIWNGAFPFLQCEVPFAIGKADEPTVSILHAPFSPFIFYTFINSIFWLPSF